jgi:copper chaperone CopZ
VPTDDKRGGIEVGPTISNAQLLEVKQTVFGMDCSPCAHGLEKRIKKMDGIQSASVSLNDGLLTAKLNNDNMLTLKEIRDAIENSGFKAQKADIIAQGTLIKSDENSFVLKVDSGEQFLLITDDQNRLNNYLENNQLVVVSGEAEIADETGIKLLIKTIDKY